MTKYYHSLIALLICIPFSLKAQQVKNEFNIIHNDKTIGTLVASKAIDGSKTTYSDDTNIEAHFFTKIKVVYKYDEIYTDGDLSKASVSIYINGHEHTKTSTVKSNTTYNFIEDEDDAVKISGPINYSTIRLLFEEPEGISKVYGEEKGNFQKLEKTGDNTYLKTTPEGHKNTYYYKDGHLQKADIHAGVISFSMQRI